MQWPCSSNIGQGAVGGVCGRVYVGLGAAGHEDRKLDVTRPCYRELGGFDV